MSALDELLARKPTTFEEAKKDTITEILTRDSRRFEKPSFTRQVTREVPPVVPGEGAGFTTTFKVGFVEDLPTKIRILARSRFPDDPGAIERFGVIGGDIVFVNQDGLLEKATGGLADLAGSALALTPEIVGSVVGSFATGNPLTGSAVGAIGGRAIKEIIGGLFFDDPKTTGGVAANLAIEGGLDIATGGLGKLGTKVAGRRAISGVTDIAETGAKRAAVADATGIELDLAQVTNLPKLKALKLWARNFPGEASEIIKANDDLIAGQVEDAINRVINAVSQTTDTARLGIHGINAAEASIQAARTTVAETAGPLYKRAFQEGAEVDVTPVIELIKNKLKTAKGAQATALKKAAKLLKVSGKKDADSSIKGLHATKLALDEMLERRGSTALGRITKRDIVQVKEVLLEQMSEASPIYNQAREVFAAESQRLVEPLQNSIIGVLAQIPEVKASRAAAALFNGGNVTPQAIKAAREAIQAVEKTAPEFEGAWDGLVRQWLEEQFVRASKELQTGEAVNVAGKFRQAVIGTKSQKEAMVEALGPEALELFEVTMEALQMVSRTPTASSATEFNRLITDELIGSVGSMSRAVLQPRTTAIRAIDDNFLQAQAVRIAEALTDPAKVAQLNALKELKSSTERSVIAASIIGLSILPRDAAGKLIFPEGTVLPPILEQENSEDE